MENLESTLQAILERNKRVEAEKAWEVSWSRRIIIMAITYMIAVFFFWTIDNAFFWLNAIVPTGGYLLSTLSLPWFKKLWMQRYVSER